MRVGTLSFTSLDNYGTVLLVYALARLLEQAGHEVCVLDYRIPGFKAHDRMRAIHLSYAGSAPWPVISSVPKWFLRSSRLEQFRKQHLARTRPVYFPGHLPTETRRLDAIITGSDEVFRTGPQKRWFRPFFLDFADPDRQKLLAYAASSGGVADYGASNDAARILLNRFHSISVRDEVTRALVEKLTGTDSPIVLDPTLLWPFDELVLPEPSQKEYVVVYGYFKSSETDRMVRETADRLGVPMLSVGWASKYAHHNLMAAGPLEWLSCIRNARLVFTNCFHGIMFSVLWQRDFLVFEAESIRQKLMDFISRFCLRCRLLPAGQYPTREQLEGMDHATLQKRLQPHRDQSRNYLGFSLGHDRSAIRQGSR